MTFTWGCVCMISRGDCGQVSSEKEKLSFAQSKKRPVASSRENWRRLTTLYVAPELREHSGSVNLLPLV